MKTSLTKPQATAILESEIYGSVVTMVLVATRHPTVLRRLRDLCIIDPDPAYEAQLTVRGLSIWRNLLMKSGRDSEAERAHEIYADTASSRGRRSPFTWAEVIEYRLWDTDGEV